MASSLNGSCRTAFPRSATAWRLPHWKRRPSRARRRLSSGFTFGKPAKFCRHSEAKPSRSTPPFEEPTHARVTKLSMTRFSPALSNSTVSLLPSTRDNRGHSRISGEKRDRRAVLPLPPGSLVCTVLACASISGAARSRHAGGARWPAPASSRGCHRCWRNRRLAIVAETRVAAIKAFIDAASRYGLPEFH